MTKPVIIGSLVKVHVSRSESLYGEVVGINAEGKLLVCARKDFANYPLSAFHHFRSFDEVVFLTDKPQYRFENPSPKVTKKIRLAKALLEQQRKEIIARSAVMDDVECTKRINAIEYLKQKIESNGKSV